MRPNLVNGGNIFFFTIFRRKAEVIGERNGAFAGQAGYVPGAGVFRSRRTEVNVVMNIRKLRKTMVAPEGRSSIKDIMMPAMTEIIPVRQEITIVALNPRENCSAVTDGMMSSDDTSMMPTTFIASTTVRAVMRTRTLLMRPVFMPEARADSSSKEMATSS